MPKHLYSFKLGRIVPMLTDDELRPIWRALGRRVSEIRQYRMQEGCSLAEAKRLAPSSAMDLYERLTGVRLASVDELYWIRLSSYGRPCPRCRRPFRTPRARMCAECGLELPAGERAGPAT